MAAYAHRALMGNLWEEMRVTGKWPNMIEVDDVRNAEVAALCMAINHRFLDGEHKVKRGDGTVKRLRGEVEPSSVHTAGHGAWSWIPMPLRSIGDPIAFEVDRWK